MLALGLAVVPATAATNGTARTERGFSYFNDRITDVPWSIHVFRLERGHPDLTLCATLGRGDTFGMATVSDQIKALPADAGKPLAAINGDFYDSSELYEGRPRDLQICNGELVSSPRGHSCFWIDRAGNPVITNVQSRLRLVWPDGTETPLGLNEERKAGAAVLYTAVVGTSTRTEGGRELLLERGSPDSPWLPLRVGQSYTARVREVRETGDTPVDRTVMVASFSPSLAKRLPAIAPGAELRVAIETLPDLAGAQVAIGGGPALVRDGQVMHWTGVQPRHPRTAVGWNHEAIFLVQVDGRQGALSIGMTLPEFAAYLVKLGCLEAMNLDGGGSSTFWALGNVVSSPSEGRERPSANALVVLQKRPKS